MMLRTLKRELFIRWVRIEHDKWYEKMVKTVFGTKTEMRYVLSLKKTMYNAWSEYCRMMKLPFSECHNFWRLLDDDTKQTLIKHAEKHTLEGSEERRQLELTLAEYPHSGPMGSQDPKLPVDVVHLERILSDENANLQEKWKKKNLYTWARTLDAQEKPYKPSRKATAILGRIMLPGEKCRTRTQIRTRNLRRLRQLRLEISTMYDKVNGSLYGLTVGLCLESGTDVWFEVVLMTNGLRLISLLFRVGVIFSPKF